MDIRILPSNIANMIAAGEVVQRPASVVKELMENSVDAGATQVSVIIKDAGRTLIQVIDNGCGMSPDQAVLAFERHATSKISSAEDLMDIHTFGFRGEALASIAAVAEVTLKTRRAGDEIGCQVDFADSQHLSTIETVTPVGSNFSVRNLFYNVPARRKFLKSESVELKHIVSEFQHVAYTRPDISFTLIHNNREIYVLKPASSLKFRIQDIVGAGVASEITDISAETSIMRVSGFIGRPDKARKGLGNQLFFVNGRYFRSPYLHKAVMKGYEGMIAEGTTPTYFIYLEVNPHEVDVNVHPQKAEIKFEDDSLVFQTLYACVRETLGKNSFGTASIDFELGSVPELPAVGRNFDEYRPVSEPAMPESGYNPFENDGFQNQPDIFTGSHPEQGSGAGRVNGYDTASYVDRRDDYGKLFEDHFGITRSFITVQDKYIVTNSKSGLLVVNARRAMERILYDRFISGRRDEDADHFSQTLLFPVSVRIGVENVPVVEANSEVLKGFGFDIAPFGTDSVVVNAIPAGYSSEEGRVETMVGDLLLLLQDNHSIISELVRSDMAGKLAVLGASGYDGVRNADEAQRLVDALMASTNPEFTAAGRKTMVIIPADELDRKF
ncbi:MAG: DNA mismatch repair endonuclease MutL [Candidatus Cryptobacteroides sp.]|nr:DNA mismatch repair endonuclease MutL [Bacteroidales bacterium]MDD7133055.1 DNA mismatch repair endonuclease MutL [Bacteroidales bacterium]MDY2773058.1 DNA mismatch repair endonuclease MutL [Candidatus Cryptobacteroides sp.]